MLPLGLLKSGEKGEIINILSTGRGMGRGIIFRLESMGLMPGKIVEILNNTGWGPMLVKVDGSRIAIGRGMAMKIMVKRLS